MANAPSWVWLLAAVALVLLILMLVGVRFDLDTTDQIVLPEVLS